METNSTENIDTLFLQKLIGELNMLKQKLYSYEVREEEFKLKLEELKELRNKLDSFAKETYNLNKQLRIAEKENNKLRGILKEKELEIDRIKNSQKEIEFISPSYNKEHRNSSDNPRLDLVYWKRDGQEPNEKYSRITLRQFVEKDGEIVQYNKLEDFIGIIYVLNELGFFARYDKTTKDMSKPIQGADLGGVFDAFSKMLYLPQIGSHNYNRYMQELYNKDIQDVIEIYKKMRITIEKLHNEREKKNNQRNI